MLAKEEGTEERQSVTEKKMFIEKWLTTAAPAEASSMYSSEKEISSLSGEVKEQNTIFSTFKNMFKKWSKRSIESDSWESTMDESHILEGEGDELVIISTLDTGQLRLPGPKVIYRATKSIGPGRPTRGYSEIATRWPSKVIKKSIEKVVASYPGDNSSNYIPEQSEENWSVSKLSGYSSKQLPILTSSQSYLKKIEMLRKHIECKSKKQPSGRKLILHKSTSSLKTSLSDRYMPVPRQVSRVSVLDLYSWTKELTGTPYLREQDRAQWEGKNREFRYRFNTLVQRHKKPILCCLKDRHSSISELSLVKTAEYIPVQVTVAQNHSIDSGVQTREESSSNDKAIRTAIWHAAVNKVRENMATIGRPPDTRHKQDLPLPKRTSHKWAAFPADQQSVCKVPSSSYCNGYNNLPRFPFNARFRQVR